MPSIVELIQAEALRYGIPPDLAIAQARVESGLNPSAVGDGGDSIGLFQIQPRWWDAWARRHGWNIRSVEGNIKAGVAILATAIRAEGGNLVNGLRRYNGGPAWESKPQTMQYASKVLRSVRTTLIRPVEGGHISSEFGPRSRPDGAGHEHHTGIDIGGLPEGSPVRSINQGTVLFAGRRGNYGNVVEIRHSDGTTSRYAHLASITVTKGQKVHAGYHIGGVGSTGRSTGPHLHFELIRKGKAIDPAYVFTDGTSAPTELLEPADPAAQDDPPSLSDALATLTDAASKLFPQIDRNTLSNTFSQLADSILAGVTVGSAQAVDEADATQTRPEPIDDISGISNQLGDLSPFLSILNESFTLDDDISLDQPAQETPL